MTLLTLHSLPWLSSTPRDTWTETLDAQYPSWPATGYKLTKSPPILASTHDPKVYKSLQQTLPKHARTVSQKIRIGRRGTCTPAPGESITTDLNHSFRSTKEPETATDRGRRELHVPRHRGDVYGLLTNNRKELRRIPAVITRTAKTSMSDD